LIDLDEPERKVATLQQDCLDFLSVVLIGGATVVGTTAIWRRVVPWAIESDSVQGRVATKSPGPETTHISRPPKPRNTRGRELKVRGVLTPQSESGVINTGQSIQRMRRTA
jgi:hypothetical protein